MNKRFLPVIFFSLFFVIKAFSQVPNGDFELWNNGEPDGWWTSNAPGIITITQTSDSHGGSSALKGEAAFNNNLLVYAIIISGEIGKKGFPVSKKYASLNGYYKLTSVSGDKISILASMYGNGKFLGVGGSLFPAVSNYTQFSIQILYNKLPDIPDSCQIAITLGNDTALVHVGSAFYIDDITLEGDVTSVDNEVKLSEFNLEQNFPNPFNPSTKIRYTLTENNHTSLKIYDMLGREVASLVDEVKSAGTYQATFNSDNSVNGNSLASGIYYYQLKSGAFIQTKKMVLVK